MKPGDYLVARKTLRNFLIKDKKYMIVDMDEVDCLIKTKKRVNSLFTFETLYNFFYTEQELRKQKIISINELR